MPGLDGLEVLKQIKRIDPEALVIIITAYASVRSALTAMKMGAYDYIQKPFKNDELPDDYFPGSGASPLYNSGISGCRMN